MSKSFRFLLGAVAVLAVGCAHEPDMTSSLESDATIAASDNGGVSAATVASASEEDKAALANEAKAALTEERPVPEAQAAEGQADMAAASAAAPVAEVAQAPAPESDPNATMNAAPVDAQVDTSAPVATTENAPATTEVVQAAAAEVVQATDVAQAPATEAQPSNVAVVSHKSTKRAHKAAGRLNRYYFLRMGDTPEYLSKLFYGTPEKADKLVEWNAPREKWEAGHIIYYKSAVKPRDRKMVSFYDEKTVSSESYVTRAGDSFARIAEEKYGSSLSAKEIAAVNDMRVDAFLPVGKELKLYPAPLSAEAPVVERKTTAQSDAEMIKREIQKVEQDNVANQIPAAVPAQPVATPMPIPDPVVRTPEKGTMASMAIGAFAARNPILMAGLGALMILIGAYFVAARKRNRSHLNF